MELCRCLVVRGAKVLTKVFRGRFGTRFQRAQRYHNAFVVDGITRGFSTRLDLAGIGVDVIYDASNMHPTRINGP